MSIQLQEIQSIYISQNRLVEGKDYVRAEWLKVDFTHTSDNKRVSVINLPIQSDTFDFHIKYQGDGSCVILYTGECSYYFDNRKTRLDLWKNNTVYKSITVPNVNVKRFTSNSEAFYVDGIQIPKYGFPARYASVNAFLSRVVISYSTIEVDGVTRYVPCQLLRSIPATLDANNIARSTGECGMIDSISGKFYGNVASSGSFTVENVDESGNIEDTRLHQIYTNKLVENVDYMIGEWLKADIPLNVKMMELPVNSNNVEYDLQRLALGNTTIFKTKNDEYKYFFWENRYTIGVYNLKSYRDVTSKSYDSTISLFHIKTTSNSVAFNSVSIGAFGLPITNILWQVSSGSANDTTKTSSIKVDGVTRYVPCKLLRPIPRNLDAQCKSRVAGECGMIDLISGRFYGNVASSGAFSLEWDKWLKDCSIQFNPETTLEYNTSIPNDYVIYGRIEVAKLTAQYTDFGFMQASNNYIILGESTVYAISDWGTNKWATFVVSYSGGYECSLQLNGVTLTTITSSTPYNEAPHIQLHGIMQINKIEHTFYPNESDPTQSHSEVWKRFVDEDGRQGLGISDLTYKIYAD